MFGIYTQFGLYSKYSYNKIWTTPYFINLISNRANFAVRGPTSYRFLDNYIFKEIDKVGSNKNV